MPLIRNTREPAKPSDEPAGDLTRALSALDPNERWAAVRTAADRPDAVAMLAHALSRESEQRVRAAIFTALARIATPESMLVVLPYLRSDDANIRTGAMDALRAMPDATKPHMALLLADPDPDVRLLACDLARGMPGGDLARLLCALIEGEAQANVCGAAVEVLAEIGDADSIAALSRCAARFTSDPFLEFAIEAAIDRLNGAAPA
jgi:HEAT repeat protein